MQQALISFQCAVYIEQYLSAMQALIYSECAPVSQGTVPVCAHSVSTGSCLLFARDDVALLHQTLTQRSHITDIDIWPESQVINGKYVRQTQETASNTAFWFWQYWLAIFLQLCGTKRCLLSGNASESLAMYCSSVAFYKLRKRCCHISSIESCHRDDPLNDILSSG